MSLPIIQQEKPTGVLKTKHKIAIDALGHALIWLGRALTRVNTYESLEKLIGEGGEAEKRFDELEAKHAPDMEDLKGQKMLGDF